MLCLQMFPRFVAAAHAYPLNAARLNDKQEDALVKALGVQGVC